MAKKQYQLTLSQIGTLGIPRNVQVNVTFSVLSGKRDTAENFLQLLDESGSSG